MIRFCLVAGMLLVMFSGCSKGEEMISSFKQKIDPPAVGKEKEEVKIELPPKALSLDTKAEGKWKLVWNDEFSDSDLTERWTLMDWASDKNEELQYYTPHNLIVRDGHLVIRTKKERFKGRQYTSGALTTENSFKFTYGKVEIRAKIPTGQGIFPAIWMVNENNGTWLPEIDIMENIGQEPNRIWSVVHWEDQSGNRLRDYYTHTGDTAFHKDFHTYGVMWEKNKISWTLDEQIIFESERFSPDTPLYIYMNTAVGGVWPGNPNFDDNSTKEFIIDYVRVFKEKNQGG
ncbi:glycoside hydrolase family 16 protein [Rossellomorea sp. NS-SX7]|uniref:glycoside hydrolase family 16 protein n=1 Tax=Rossellomorea sp. NS-SX7 TaxID=3463856 RepID=UPI00405816FA